MWYWIGKFESFLFYFPFLIYAYFRHIPYSTRCRSCGKWLWRWEHCRSGLCEKCADEKAKNRPEQFYEYSYSRAVNKDANFSHNHLNEGIPERIKCGKILEVGCGTGSLLSKLQSPNRQLFGTDISPAAVKITQAHATGAYVCAADARSLPFKSNSFDWLICLEVLEHIDGDKGIRECFRVLKLGGKALFSVPNGKGIGGRVEGHVSFFSFASFLEYVRQSGFEIVTARKVGLWIPILTYTMAMLSTVTGKNIRFNYPLNISVPEFLAVSFLIECRKPLT